MYIKNNNNNNNQKGNSNNNNPWNNGNPVASVPEPGSFLLLLAGIGAVALTLREKR